MNAQASPRYRALNQRAQPVELHCGVRVVVVPPHGEVELSAEEIASPQVAYLSRQSYLEIRPIETAPPETRPARNVPRDKPSRAPTGKTPATSSRQGRAPRAPTTSKPVPAPPESQSDTK